MGGHALLKYGITTVRKSTSEHERISHEILSKLRSLLNTEVKTTKYFHEKESHGDLDVLIKNTGNLPNMIKFIKENFNTEFINKNSSVYSFAYGDYQVDFILLNENEFDTIYFDYDPSANLTGKLAKTFKMKYGQEGLIFPFRGFSGTVSKNIVVSKDNRKIFEFLDLDYDRYLMGFDKVEEIFDFIISSKYFNPEKFKFENLTHIDRKRNMKRKTYKEFLEYANGLNFKRDIKKYSLEESIDIIDNNFPDVKLREQFNKFEDFNRKIKERSEKMNGNIIMNFTCLKDKELGQFIHNFKNSFENYDDFIDEHSKEEIFEKLKEFYKKSEK